jgi:hypothetical protein
MFGLVPSGSVTLYSMGALLSGCKRLTRDLKRCDFGVGYADVVVR